jgi:diketogulonate reductase-like aldo/keto reductase
VVAAIAQDLGRTPAQILIRWSLENRFVTIPKSARPDRIKSNADVFDWELPARDLKRLDALDQDLHFDWDPTDVP